MTENERKLNLIREAISDWGKGILSDYSTLYAIHMIISEKKKISKEAMEWVKKNYHKWESES
jgi:hypothetical protein